MSEAIIAIFTMYAFILIGFTAKKVFKDDIQSVTLNMLSIYFLQPFLTFWGLMQRPIDRGLLLAPIWYLVIVVLVLMMLYPFVKFIFKEPQDRSIATVAALIGNTGNIGIPLGIAIFGIQSVPYMTLINLMNVFVVYTLGVFFYSRGSFSTRESLLNIVKLPILWFAILAIMMNIGNVVLSDAILKMLMMGAYASIVIQLLLFGVYLYEAKFIKISKRLITWVLGMKFIIIPSFTLGLLYFIPIEGQIKAMIFMELFMPLAVANINLSSLYRCKPQTVTVLVFLTSLLFLGLIFLYIPILVHLF